MAELEVAAEGLMQPAMEVVEARLEKQERAAVVVKAAVEALVVACLLKCQAAVWT
jgi:hypothetical protein